VSTKVGDETIRNVNLVTVTDPLLGQVVESYKVESLVGTGAMAWCTAGYTRSSARPSPSRCSRPTTPTIPRLVQRLIREARTVNAIRHPAIVDIFGFGTLPAPISPTS